MSERADIERNRRRAWAARGGAHDRLVRTLQLTLPATVGALAAVMLFAPFSERGQISFLVAKDAIEVVSQRIMVSNALYRGNDSTGRRFTLSADSAVQRSATDSAVRMTGLTAQIALADGPARLTADSGRYEPVRDTVMVAGPLRFTSADGYQLNTRDVLLDIRSQRVASNSPVVGETTIGRFSADRMSADLNSRIVRLSGNVRLRITQGIR